MEQLTSNNLQRKENRSQNAHKWGMKKNACDFKLNLNLE